MHNHSDKDSKEGLTLCLLCLNRKNAPDGTEILRYPRLIRLSLSIFLKFAAFWLLSTLGDTELIHTIYSFESFDAEVLI